MNRTTSKHIPMSMSTNTLIIRVVAFIIGSILSYICVYAAVRCYQQWLVKREEQKRERRTKSSSDGVMIPRDGVRRDQTPSTIVWTHSQIQPEGIHRHPGA